ncbi:hypothetical protein QE372_001150 [Agrobacterium pusense]|jgi:hypothetical protein|uniref:Uncharacterized protein n=1 Tax=Agrobacterium pusense TaxID=648995 RepID=U4PV44_9HYPH|nr:hypothetical protein [Agrobacterium pusense]CDI07806.1 protein of unknown function [Agrobacterium pusense]
MRGKLSEHIYPAASSRCRGLLPGGEKKQVYTARFTGNWSGRRATQDLSFRNSTERNLIAINRLLSCSCLILSSCFGESTQTGLDYERFVAVRTPV